MTKETMIWQTLSMIIAGMVMHKTLPETKKQCIDKIVRTAMGIIDYSKKDIIQVFKTTNCTEFAEVLGALYAEKSN